MLLTIPDLLTDNELVRVRELLADAPFVDGRLSAGADAVRVKNNEELDPASGLARELNELTMGRLYAHAIYQSAALPLRLSAAFFARYTEGMSYGDHVDDPIMGEGNRYRSDVSATVFLSDTDDYDGGELVIQSEFGERAVKLPAGQAVFYSSSSRHRVNPVTRGTRLVAVCWAQSLIRDPVQRELLYELSVARESLRTVLPDAEVTATVNKTYVNLVRMWSEL